MKRLVCLPQVGSMEIAARSGVMNHSSNTPCRRLRKARRQGSESTQSFCCHQCTRVPLPCRCLSANASAITAEEAGHPGALAGTGLQVEVAGQLLERQQAL